MLVLAVLAAGSLWSWRSLVAAGIATHAPIYRYLGPLGAGGDDGQAILFMKWLPFALAHGLNPLFTKALFAPQGINVLSNTSCLFEAFLLAPLTIWWGPVAAFDVGVLLAPVVSGAALYFVLRRYRFGMGASLVAGLLYGYSPYLMREAPFGHFHASWIFFPPLGLYLLDEIVSRRELAPSRAGFLLGLLTVAQFFTSLEVLLDTVMVGVLLVLLAAATHPRTIRASLGGTAVGLGTAAAVAGALLAYPAWYLLAGPQHVSIFNSSVSTIDQAVTSAFWPSQAAAAGARLSMRQRIDAGYVGPVACVLLFVSCAWWRRNRLVPYAVAGAVFTYVLSWGPYLRVGSSGFTHVKGPDYWLLQPTLLRNIQEYRLAAFTDLFVAFAVALCLDRATAKARDWAGARAGPSRATSPAWQGAAAAVVVLIGGAAVLTLPAFGADWHQPDQRVAIPAVLTSGPMAHLRVGTTVLVSPSPYVNNGSPLVWQAVSGLRYDNVNGYAWRAANRNGLGSTLPAPSAVAELLGPGPFGTMPPPPRQVDRAELAALRSTLMHWRVQDIVLVRGYADATGGDPRILAALLGAPPLRIQGSLLWTDVRARLAHHTGLYPSELVVCRGACS